MLLFPWGLPVSHDAGDEGHLSSGLEDELGSRQFEELHAAIGI